MTFEENLEAQGYTSLRKLTDGRLIGLLQFNFTWGLVVGLNEAGYDFRYCYEHLQDAARDVEIWSGTGDPAGPWIKQKGQGIDRLNPAIAHLHIGEPT